MNRRHVLTVILMLTNVSAGLAQTAGMMSFQGYIKDGAGVPLSGPHDFLFEIIDTVSPTPNVLATFTQSGVQATQGVVSTKYGPVSPSLFDGLTPGGATRRLRVTVTSLNPDLVLTPVDIVTPPAVAEQLNARGTGNSALVADSSGRIGIGVDSPGAMLHLRTNGSGSTGGILVRGDDGISDAVAIYSRALDGVRNGNIELRHGGVVQSFLTAEPGLHSYFLGRLGVGIDNPSSPFEVRQNSDQVFGGARITSLLGTLSMHLWRDANGAHFDGDTGNAPVIINGAGSGKVGIGTATPAGRLTISHNSHSAIRIEQPGLETWSIGSTSSGANGLLFFNESDGADRFFLAQDGNVGIGTIAPEAKLAVRGGLNGTTSFLARLGTVGNSTGTGSLLQFVAGEDSSPIEIGRIFGMIRGGGLATLSLGGGGPDTLHVTNGQRVGIGDFAPTEKLVVAGNILATGCVIASNVSCPSDARYKTNVASLGDALATLAKLRAVSFDWRCAEFPNRNFDDKPQIGFIAQEMLEVVPEVVQQGSDGYYSVDYGRLTPVLTAAVQELNRKHETEIARKDEQIAAANRRIDALTARLEKLEAALTANGEVRR